jgi:hypothetical protein
MDILMIVIRRITSIRSAMLAVLLLAPMCVQGKHAKNSEVLDYPVDSSTVIRLFFQPPAGNYFHVPLVFRVVDEGDLKANTAPISSEGRTAYISLSEMRRFLKRMNVKNLHWQESKSVETVEPSFSLPVIDQMVITVFSSNGTARAYVMANRVCQTLAPFSSIIVTPRARWEFKSFQTMYFCNVTGFDRNAYPDHY